MKRHFTFVGLLALLPWLIASVTTDSIPDPRLWEIDVDHSSVNFTATHFFIPVEGRFEVITGMVGFDPENLTESFVDIRIPISSVNTSDSKRDKHLLSRDFFNARKWPRMTFTGTEFKRTSENEYVVQGELTIRDQKKEVELPFTFLGMKTLDDGSTVSGIQLKHTITRTDYGIGKGSWAKDAVLGEEVDVEINLELRSR